MLSIPGKQGKLEAVPAAQSCPRFIQGMLEGSISLKNYQAGVFFYPVASQKSWLVGIPTASTMEREQVLEKQAGNRDLGSRE